MGKATAPRSHKARPKPSLPGAGKTLTVVVVDNAGKTRIETRAVPPDDGSFPGTWGIDKELPRLSTAGNVEIRRDVAKHVTGARRKSVFDTLHATKDGGGDRVISKRQLNAVDRLADDLARRDHTCGSSQPGAGAVDTSEITDPMDARLKASDRIDTVLGATGAASAGLLLALLNPATLDITSRDKEGIARSEAPWRRIVTAATKITNAPAQVAAVVIACENLACAYAQWDRGDIRVARRVAA